MQYHIQTLVKHLFDKDSFEQVTVQELKQFTDDYPYAAVGQFLYAKKLKDAGSYNHYEQSEQASLYFHNALWLRYTLNQKEEAPALPVHAEEPAQQPGFRIVVQMPKTVPVPAPLAKANTPVASEGNGVNKEEAVTEMGATAGTVENKTAVAEQPAQSVQPERVPPAEAAPVAAAETGTPEENIAAVAAAETVATEQEAATAASKEETIASAEKEATSAVAIAEISQLAEESVAEAAVNAVSITEEVLTPPSTSGDANSAEPIAPSFGAEPVENTEAPPVPAETAPAEEPVTTSATVVAEQTPAQAEAIAEPVKASATVVAEQPAAAEATTGSAPASATPVQEPELRTENLEQNQQPVVFTPASQEAKSAVDLGEPIFESYHTIDYFASQGIKLQQDDFKDRLGKQLKSFTDWLRSMKRIGPIETNTSLDEVTNQSIQRIAEHSVEEKEIVTEAMAEVWAKQGHPEKAIRIYEKLSLHNPAKSPYFAGRIEQLKAL